MKKIFVYLLVTLIIAVGLYFIFRGKHDVQWQKPKSFCLTDTLANVQLSQVGKKEVYREITLGGKISFDRDNVAKIYPLVGGFVKSLPVNLGDFVSKGALLAVIRSPEVASFMNESSAAKASFDISKKNYEIAKELYQTGTISEVDLLEAKKDFQTDTAELYRTNEVLSIYNVGKESFYSIVSPISGFVISKDVTPDAELRTEDVKPIFTISNLNKVWVMTNVYESDIEVVKEGLDVEVRTISYHNKVFKGKIDKIFNVIDPESKVLNARVTLDNPNYELKPEMYADVTVRSMTGTERVCVPSGAVIFDKNQYYVIVYKGRCNLEKRKIKINSIISGDTFIDSGLEEGEQVITKYQLLVYAALK